MVGERPTACLELSRSTGPQLQLQSSMQVAAASQERIRFLAGRRTERVLDSDAENKSQEGSEGPGVLVIIPGPHDTFY